MAFVSEEIPEANREKWKYVTGILSSIFQSAKRTIKGKEKLYIAFWGWFIGFLTICWLIYFNITLPLIFKTFSHISIVVYLTVLFFDMIVITLAFRAFIFIGLWRCAKNTRHKVWFYATRLIAIVFAAFSVYGIIANVTTTYQSETVRKALYDSYQ